MNNWLISCIVPESKLHHITGWLEDNGADHFTIRPVRSIPGKPAPANGHGGARSGAKLKQGKWLKQYFKAKPGKLDAKHFREAWNKAGFKDSARHSAISNAQRYKHIKRVAGGYQAVSS